MPLYLVSYDIANKDDSEYRNLWAKLRELKAAKILYSQWVLPGDVGQAASIYHQLARLTQEKDRLLVQELTHDEQWDKLLVNDDVFAKILATARSRSPRPTPGSRHPSTA
jgi:CRISPR/Cas system-associated endoribonuclease Cas2